MGKKINQLDPATDEQASENNRLMPLADPTTGIALYVSIEQLKLAFQTKVLYYTTSGSEGTTLTPPEIAEKFIVGIDREGGPLYEAQGLASPTSSEYSWDLTDITLGAAVSGAGERFRIMYRDF